MHAKCSQQTLGRCPQLLDDISVTKLLNTSNDITVTKFLEQAQDDIAITKYLADMLVDEVKNDISVTNFLNAQDTWEDAQTVNAVESYLNGPPELSLH